VKTDLNNIPPLDQEVLTYIHIRIADNPVALDIAEELWREAWSLIDPAEWTSCIKREDFFSIFHPYAQQSSAVRTLLSDAVGVCLLLATLGPSLERRAKDYLADKESYRGFILDRFGSYLVEEKIRSLDDRVEIQSRANGSRCTRRYSPGYGDFSPEAQMVFVEKARDEIPFLKIVSGGMIFPEKTVTAIKGIFAIGRFEET
jgi:hypothetical protein